MSSYLFSSESVSPGHPDKLCDRISDAILDSYLQGDPDSRVAVECMATANKLLISGEVSSNAALTSNDIERIARGIIQVTGYNKDEYLYTFNKTNVEVLINRQSPDIARGVDRQDPRLQGAGDQGIMFGYATDETPHFMPLPIMLAHEIMDYFYRYRRSHPDCILRPDAKSQVTVQYEDNVPVKIDTILISHQHDDVPQEEVNKFISEVLSKFLLENFGEGCKYPSHLIQDNMKVYINPTGKFVIGGPVGDCGLTGRKIIVDTYGGRSAHGGGAFCVDGDTEYLTPNGWKKMSEYQEGDLVAQWDDYKLSFVKPLARIECDAEDMFHIHSSTMYDMVLSKNHDLVIETSKGNIIKKRCKDLIDINTLKIKNGNAGYVPVSFNIRPDQITTSIPLTDDEIRLQVAYCADGSSNKERLRCKKDYKKERLEMLLKNTNTDYRISTDRDEESDYVNYYFKPPINSRKLTECFRNANLHQMRVIADELVQWDGNRYDCFRTTIKEDADFAQFLFMAAYGTRASIKVDDRRGRQTHVDGYDKAYTVNCILYSVYRLNTTKVMMRNSSARSVDSVHIERFESKDGKMYCFSVPSGMLLLRRNYKVFVTGNSGKDPSKVDRSAAYMARYIAKNLVATRKMSQCSVQLAYGIGMAEPISVYITSNGTCQTPDEKLSKIVCSVFDLTPYGIIQKLDLKRPIFYKTAFGGHFGREIFPWEQIDMAETLKNLL